jgi:hypothetical protein
MYVPSHSYSLSSKLTRQCLSNNQLSQCKGDDYDKIQRLLDGVEEQLADFDDDDDEASDHKKRALLTRYKTYLERTRKQRKISDRANDITTDLVTKLQDHATEGTPEVIHASASEYMDWIRKSKITYLNQPALPVDITGIPAIREFLLSLPAQQNIEDYYRHMNVTMPAFIEKIKRTVSETDRDGGFRNIAEETDRVRKASMAELLNQIKSSFQ